MENDIKNFTIKWCNVAKKGNTNGRDWTITSMTLIDEQGNETPDVSTFTSVMNGGTLEGRIVKNDKGYLNFVPKLEAPEFIKKGNSNFKTQQIEKSMERKETSINKFQDNKEWSIKVASSMNKAIDLTIAEMKGELSKMDSGDVAEMILKWRKWILNNWDVDYTDVQPF